MKTNILDAAWTLSKAFFFFLGVYWLFATIFDFSFGADGDEYGVILAFVLAIGVAIFDAWQNKNSP